MDGFHRIDDDGDDVAGRKQHVTRGVSPTPAGESVSRFYAFDVAENQRVYLACVGDSWTRFAGADSTPKGSTFPSLAAADASLQAHAAAAAEGSPAKSWPGMGKLGNLDSSIGGAPPPAQHL
jgi:hypothetical protein